jgi:hypothetical protein
MTFIFCKDCPDRVLYCHANCEKYLAEKERLEKVRAARVQWQIENSAESARVGRCLRVREARRRRGKL